MLEKTLLKEPAIAPPLDPEFRPAVLANRQFRAEVDASGEGVPLVFGLERPGGVVSRFETRVFPEGHPRAGQNLAYAERLLKFLRGSGASPTSAGREHRRVPAAGVPGGERALRALLRRSTASLHRDALRPGGRLPSTSRHLDGCRIGFDLGASDRRCRRIDGEASQHREWSRASRPTRPTTAKRLCRRCWRRPRCPVDAGGSSAGVYIAR